MTALTNLAAVRVTLGSQNFYIPASQVGRCALVTHVVPEIPRFVTGWVLPMSRRRADTCIYAFLTAALIPAGTFGDSWRT